MKFSEICRATQVNKGHYPESLMTFFMRAWHLISYEKIEAQFKKAG